MRIGYDTLSENPFRPSSAINYVQSLLKTVAAISPGDSLFVFVSPRNRDHFPCREQNLHEVMCAASNENIAARIAVQQYSLPRLAKRHKLDIVYGLNQVPLFSPCPTVVKLCTLHHIVTPEEYTTKNPANVLRLLYRRAMFQSSAVRARIVIANSQYTKDCIVERMKIPESKVRVVYEAVDDRFGTIDPVSARDFVQSKLGLKRPFILYVSNLWFYKNPDGAVRSFATLRKRYGDDIDLVVAGRDDFGRTPALRRLAEEEGMDGRVHFLGRIPFEHLLNLYAAARVIFYPSFAETFGKPVVEGMRSGVPVVASNSTSIPELANGSALLVDPKDTEANAEALHRAICNEETRQALIASGKQRAKAFSWAQTAKGTVDAWRAALASGSA
jgi:glycosyltransferase involved in cell wall biosynthesis